MDYRVSQPYMIRNTSINFPLPLAWYSRPDGWPSLIFNEWLCMLAVSATDLGCLAARKNESFVEQPCFWNKVQKPEILKRCLGPH
jgi:hypothetical protein